MGPMARKKRVNEKYCPNSYRVISYEEEKRDKAPIGAFKMPSNVNMLGQSSEPKSLFEHRKNRPNPTSVGFLSQDVRLLNEPICHVQTSGTSSEQHSWWPSRANEPNKHQPVHTLDTTFRQDYQQREAMKKGSARHTANPNKRPALGSVPVNFLREPDGVQRVWKEKISYEHKYNCRTEPQYPIRAKRHGAFVWDRFPQTEVQRMIDHYGADNQKPASVVPAAVTPNSPMSAPLSNSSKTEGSNQSSTSDMKSLSHTPLLPPISN